MSEGTDQAALLDRYLDALRRDPAAPAPEGLDAATASLARALAARADRAVQPDPEGGRRTLAAARAADGRATRRGVPPFARRAGIAALAAALLLLVAGAAFWRARPRPPAAAEVLARAEQAAANPAAGVPRLHGTITGHSRAAAGLPFTEWQQEVWFQAPASRRLELHQAPPGAPPAAATPAPDPANPRGAVAIYVTDGATAWRYRADRRTAELVAPSPLGGLAFGTTDPLALLAAPPPAAPALRGADTVAGRPADVLALGRPPGSAPPDGPAEARLWIDRQTALPLRLERRDAAGNLLTAWAFTALEVNPALDAGLFQFRPPAGAAVVDARAEPTPTPERLP